MSCYIKNICSISPQNSFVENKFPAKDSLLCTENETLRAIEPDYKLCIEDSGLRRRMSHIVKMGVASGLKCLGKDECDAIITATGLGCLADTEKFLRNIIEEDEQLLNPTAFIQSTFNTIGGQIALIKKLNCYNLTYVHRGFSFESAVTDALMKIKYNEAEKILVGAIDEITETEFTTTSRLGFWHRGAKMGEGANFFLLSNKNEEDSLAKLTDVEQFKPTFDNSIADKIEYFLTRNKLNINKIDLIMLGKNGDCKSDKEYDAVCNSYFHNKNIGTFKHLCGEYPTASAFGLWCASLIIKEQKVPNYICKDFKGKINRILLYNIYNNDNHSLFLIESN